MSNKSNSSIKRYNDACYYTKSDKNNENSKTSENIDEYTSKKCITDYNLTVSDKYVDDDYNLNSAKNDELFNMDTIDNKLSIHGTYNVDTNDYKFNTKIELNSNYDNTSSIYDYTLSGNKIDRINSLSNYRKENMYNYSNSSNNYMNLSNNSIINNNNNNNSVYENYYNNNDNNNNYINFKDNSYASINSNINSSNKKLYNIKTNSDVNTLTNSNNDNYKTKKALDFNDNCIINNINNIHSQFNNNFKDSNKSLFYLIKNKNNIDNKDDYCPKY